MNISAIGAGAARPSWAAQVAARAQVAAAKSSEAAPAPAPVPVPRPAPRKTELAPLDVRIETRPNGGHQLTIVDKTTGQVYCQLPPEQIVQVLEDALRRMQREDG